MLGFSSIPRLLWLRLQLVLKLKISLPHCRDLWRVCKARRKHFMRQGLKEKTAPSNQNVGLLLLDSAWIGWYWCNYVELKDNQRQINSTIYSYHLPLYWLPTAIQPCLSFCSLTALLEGLRSPPPPFSVRWDSSDTLRLVINTAVCHAVLPPVLFAWDWHVYIDSQGRGIRIIGC